MPDRVDDLKRSAQEARGTFGPACITCAFARGEKCGFTGFYQTIARGSAKLCGPNGRNWEPKPPRLGLIPWFRRLLWGDASSSDGVPRAGA